MNNVIRTVNPLKAWIVESRAEERRAPQLYLAYYWSGITVDDTSVLMVRSIYETIERNCGRYDAAMPTGEYCGRVFLRGKGMCWYGISKISPMRMIETNYREVVIIDGF